MDSVIQMLPPSLRRWSTFIDFPGQLQAERVFQFIIVVASVVGFLVGYVAQQLWLTFAILGAGFVIANLVCLPPWPALRRHPVRWLPSTEDQIEVVREVEKKKDKKRQ